MGRIGCPILQGTYVARKNEVEELQTDPQKSRVPTWLGCLGYQQAAGYPKTEFSFYALKNIPTYPVKLHMLKVPFFRKFDGAQKNMPNHYSQQGLS